MGWNRESILNKQREITLAQFGEASRDELLEVIAAMRAAAYPFLTTMTSLDDEYPSHRSTCATSKLFPAVYDSKEDDPGFGEHKHHEIVVEDNKCVWRHYTLTSDELHTKEYELKEFNIDVIKKGGREQDSQIRKLDDSVELLSVFQSVTGGSVMCGSIYMGDVRYAEDVFATGKAKLSSEGA